ncbi:hypothetical protein [Streptomyces sp. NPDC087856]|uniref:hypothetical protein n=1 Tax=Streptomyces sp. NPDC087856 TaxID=3365811 RepID=UPI00382E43EE
MTEPMAVGLGDAAKAPASAGRADQWPAASCFHDASYAREWQKPGADAEFRALVELLVRGLRN